MLSSFRLSNALRRGSLCLSALALLSVAACGQKSPTEPAQAPDAAEVPATADAASKKADWAAFRDAFQEDTFAADPGFAVSQGRHEFDGQLPDWSADGIAKEIARLDGARSKALAFTDDALTADERFERQYFVATIDGKLFWLRDVGVPFHNPGFYLSTDGLDPSTYLTRPYASLDVRLKAFTAYLKAVPNAVAQIRANLKSPMPKTFVTLGINGFGGFPDFFRKDVPPIFADVKDEALQADFKAALEPAAKSLEELTAWLKSEQPKANDDYALGADRFAKMLYATERVSTPLKDLEAVGQADLKRNLDALKTACATFAPKATLHACVDQVNADKPKGGAVEGARAQLDALRQFIIDKQLVTIPSDEKALVGEAPPYQRWNFAYIDIPGPYDKGMPSTYYIAPPDPTWPKKEQDAYTPGAAVLLFTSAHEVWPGHFLQFLHSNRSPSKFGQLFVGYAFAEGWAHYSEEMMWDAGLGGDEPKQRAKMKVGQLSEALLRDVRFICAIGLHTQGMSVQTCETMFKEDGFQDAGNARQQAARGTYDAAYLNYTMGKLMIMKLREDWTKTHGGRDGWHAFHDQFLSYGGPPIPLVREQMLGADDKGSLF
jgi:predicted small lipoprotein YifL